MEEFIITHNGSPLVCVKNVDLVPPSDILGWYAMRYGYDRHRLGWCTVRTVTWSDDGGVLKPTVPATIGGDSSDDQK